MIRPAISVGCLLTCLVLPVSWPVFRPGPVQAEPVASVASANQQKVLTVAGSLPRTGSVSLSDLVKLAPFTDSWTSHGTRHVILGVPLSRVLSRFGFTPGAMGKEGPKEDKRSGFKLVVVASAPDGFQAVFSAAELTETMGATRAYVVWQVDGKPLPEDKGPFRLVVTTDKEPSRCIYQLERLDVVDMRKVVPPLAGK